MAGDVTYTVLNPSARRQAVAPMMAQIAAEIAGAAAAATPVRFGDLAASYLVSAGRDPGTTLVESRGVAHGKYIEYGTRHMRAVAPLGRAFAAAKGRYG